MDSFEEFMDNYGYEPIAFCETTKTCDEDWIRGLEPQMRSKCETDYFTLTRASEIMIYDLSSTRKAFICPPAQKQELGQ